MKKNKNEKGFAIIEAHYQSAKQLMPSSDRIIVSCSEHIGQRSAIEFNRLTD